MENMTNNNLPFASNRSLSRRSVMDSGEVANGYEGSSRDVETDDVTEYMYRPNLCVEMPSEKLPPKESRISCIEKTTFYFTVSFFWFLSLLTIGLGIYVYHERTVPIMVVLEMHIDPSSILIVCGLIAFMLTISGFVGGLRENICLLKLFAFGLLILVTLQTAFLVLIFVVFYTNINITVNPYNLLQSALMLYSEDNDSRDLIDFLQINFHCCGIGDNGYLDWKQNPYFNCSATNFNVQRCGVPFSCCRNLEEESMNTLCGYGTTNETLTLFDAQHRIYTDGCVYAIIRLLQENAFLTGANVFGTTILMLIGVFSAARMATRVQRNKDYYMLSLQATTTTLL